MNSVIINKEKCVGCGECQRDCVSYKIKIENNKAVFSGDTCLECGHCFAVCPVSAVSMPAYDTSDCEKISDIGNFDSDEFLLSLKSRRSIRQFAEKCVSDEDILKITEAARYAPTGTNSQDIHYTVIGEKLPELEEIAVNVFRKAKKSVSPLSKYLSSIEIEDKFFSKGAPVALIISGKSKTNACIASVYAELMAENLGLGVLYSGFFLGAAKLSPKIKKAIDIPFGFTPFVCLFIGHPDVRYKRIVPRKKAYIKFI